MVDSTSESRNNHVGTEKDDNIELLNIHLSEKTLTMLMLFQYRREREREKDSQAQDHIQFLFLDNTIYVYMVWHGRRLSLLCCCLCKM